MRFFLYLLFLVALASPVTPASAQTHKQVAQWPRIQSAKSAYFQDKTGADAVGNMALTELKKWGRFRIVQDPKEADLIILLSSDPYKGGFVIVSGGQTGTVGENGQIEKDRTPNWDKLAPVRYAYLTVIDPKTGDTLWSDDHQWGGLLTGFNTAGERLVKKFEKQIKKQKS